MEEYGTWQGASPFSHLAKPLFTPRDALTPFSKQWNQTLRWRHSVTPNTPATLHCWNAECLWRLRNGFYSTSTIVPGFLKHIPFAQQWQPHLVRITSPGCGYMQLPFPVTFPYSQRAFSFSFFNAHDPPAMDGRGWSQTPDPHRNKVDNADGRWIGAQASEISEQRHYRAGGVQACGAFREENIPRVSFLRGNPHVSFSKVKPRCNITVKAVMYGANSHSLHLYDLLASFSSL